MHVVLGPCNECAYQQWYWLDKCYLCVLTGCLVKARFVSGVDHAVSCSQTPAVSPSQHQRHRLEK